MSQKYLYVPVLVNVILTVFGVLLLRDRPVSICCVPSYVADAMSVNSAGLRTMLGWCPSNQKSFPAGSLTPEIVEPLRMSGRSPPPTAGMSTVWNPSTLNDTESPLLMVTRLLKKL